MTGSVKANVEPWPTSDSTQILPPCEPQAGAALLARDRVVGLLELLKQLGLIGCLRTRRAAGVVLQYSSDRHASYRRPRSGEVRKNGFPQRWAFIKIKSFRY